jgi:hypothetical protein
MNKGALRRSKACYICAHFDVHYSLEGNHSVHSKYHSVSFVRDVRTLLTISINLLSLFVQKKRPLLSSEISLSRSIPEQHTHTERAIKKVINNPNFNYYFATNGSTLMKYEANKLILRKTTVLRRLCSLSYSTALFCARGMHNPR